MFPCVQIVQVCKEAADYCDKAGMDISKLALAFSLSHPDIPTTLVSTASITRLQDNIDTAQNIHALTDAEKQMIKTLSEKFFEPLKGSESWEGVEVAQYWESVGKQCISEKIYGGAYYQAERLSTL